MTPPSGFDALMLVVILLAHGYLWWRLVRSTTRRGRSRRLLTWAFTVLALLVTLSLLIPFPPSHWCRSSGWASAGSASPSTEPTPCWSWNRSAPP